MLTVTYRPEADLYINNPPEYAEVPYYTSRWSSAHLPLVYKIANTKFPTNTTDSVDVFSEVINRNGFARFNLSGGSYEVYVLGEKVVVTGTTNYDGIHEVREVVAGEYITLDILFVETETGSLQRYYNNYSVLVRLYAGVPFYHPYYSTDPIALIGTFAIAPNSDNISIIDVKDLVRQKISQDNEIDGTGRPNDLNAWTSFYIEYAETYDEYSTGIPETFTSDYSTDYLEGCTDVTLENFAFISNLDSWNQNGEGTTNAWVWDAGSAKATVGGTDYSYFRKTNLLYQTGLVLKAGIVYTINIVGSYSQGSYDKVTTGFRAYAGINSNREKYLLYESGDLSIGPVSLTTSFTFTLPEDCTTVGFMLTFGDTYPSAYVQIDSFSFNNTPSDSTSCLAYIFAHNGTRQFFDLIKNSRSRYGGNMAEYVQSYNNETYLNKFLTRFEDPVYFVGKYFDISTIIPQSTIDIPFTQDGLILRINNVDFPISNEGDGVYRLTLHDKIDSSDETAEIQIIRKQTIVDWLSVVIKSSGNEALIGRNNYFTGTTLSEECFAVSVFESGAILLTSDGFNNNVYRLQSNAWVLIYSTSSTTLRHVKAFDDNNWAACNFGEGSVVLSISGTISEISIPATPFWFGVDGANSSLVYFLDQSPFTAFKIQKIENGLYSNVYTHNSTAYALIDGRNTLKYYDGVIYFLIRFSGNTLVARYNTTTATYTSSVLSSTMGAAIDVKQESILACTQSEVFLWNGTSYIQDTDFDTIRSANGDSTTIVSGILLDQDTVSVLSEGNLYNKISGVWYIGAGGDYTPSNLKQVSGYYNGENVELQISETKTIQVNNNCSAQEIYMSWMNTLGNWEYWNFTARKNYEKLVEAFSEVRRNIYANWPEGFSTETEDDKISISSYDKITVRSQFVTKGQLDILAEIIHAIRVQVWYGSEEKITVKVDSDSIKKYSDGDKLYAIEFDIIYPMIQIQQQ